MLGVCSRRGYRPRRLSRRISAAQAFIFESVGKMFKTHKGVQTEFLRLTKDDPRFKHDLRIFLSQAYNLKSIADYEEGPGSEVSAERAAAAIEPAARFIDCIAGLIGEGS
jgi:uncharacterized protein (UPF0332 family)